MCDGCHSVSTCQARGLAGVCSLHHPRSHRFLVWFRSRKFYRHYFVSSKVSNGPGGACRFTCLVCGSGDHDSQETSSVNPGPRPGIRPPQHPAPYVPGPRDPQCSGSSGGGLAGAEASMRFRGTAWPSRGPCRVETKVGDQYRWAGVTTCWSSAAHLLRCVHLRNQHRPWAAVPCSSRSRAGGTPVRRSRNTRGRRPGWAALRPRPISFTETRARGS